MIVLKSKSEIEQVKKSCMIVASVLEELKKIIEPGVTCQALNELAEKLILQAEAIPAFKGYRGFPAALCTSVNDQIVHGIPDGRRLKEGDIVSLDLGAKLNGFYGDCAITVPVGDISEEAERLLRVTETSLYLGIQQAVVGNRLFDISHAVQSWVEKNGFSVVRDFVGHGIGRELHEEPQVPNFGVPHHGPRLEEGMVFALEPMVNAGTFKVKILPDGWTAVTADGSLSAHFEHTIAISGNGPEILSRVE
jgi:methionyl aminopeptidase